MNGYHGSCKKTQPIAETQGSSEPDAAGQALPILVAVVMILPAVLSNAFTFTSVLYMIHFSPRILSL
jgi:hypothetical protein